MPVPTVEVSSVATEDEYCRQRQQQEGEGEQGGSDRRLESVEQGHVSDTRGEGKTHKGIILYMAVQETHIGGGLGFVSFHRVGCFQIVNPLTDILAKVGI